MSSLGRRLGRGFLAGAALALISISAASAASLRVAPVIVNVAQGASATSVRVWNDHREPVHVQARIFRAIYVNGEEVLEPTSSVAVSPPIAVLEPGAANVVRVVRVSPQAIVGPEKYRLLIDQIPDRTRHTTTGVSLVVRHAIPVTFN